LKNRVILPEWPGFYVWVSFGTELFCGRCAQQISKRRDRCPAHPNRLIVERYFLKQLCRRASQVFGQNEKGLEGEVLFAALDAAINVRAI
jgi:hypothetical protein